MKTERWNFEHKGKVSIWVFELMSQIGVGEKEFAEMCNVSQPAVRSWLTGKIPSGPSRRLLDIIGSSYGMSLTDALGSPKYNEKVSVIRKMNALEDVEQSISDGKIVISNDKPEITKGDEYGQEEGSEQKDSA